jgi:hypothetical protein
MQPSMPRLTRLSEPRPLRSLSASQNARRSAGPLVSELNALLAKQSHYQSLEIDEGSLDILIGELRKGLLAARRTVRRTLRRLVRRIEVNNGGGALGHTLPRLPCLMVPQRGFEQLDCQLPLRF